MSFATTGPISFELQHEIDPVAVEGRARHAGDLGVRRILHDRSTARVPDGLQSGGAVSSAAGQDDADRPLAVDPRDGIEQDVNG